jgi:hypothetical protein
MITTETAQLSSPSWNATSKWLFRFSCVYWLLYNFPFPLTELPLAHPLLGLYDDAWNTIVVWIGRVVFG